MPEALEEALEMAHGDFGRVALRDMDRGLVRHAHHHCHVLLKVAGDDTQFPAGEPVAVVLGRDRDVAEDGCDLIEVAYRPRPGRRAWDVGPWTSGRPCGP